MQKRSSPKKVALPFVLVEAIKEQRVVLVFGAGASMECRDEDGKMPPNGEQLRDHLAKKFLGTTNERRDLATVAEMAIESGAGEPIVFEEIAKLLSGFKPSVAHSKIAEFMWRGIATTNYDTFIEQAYAANSHKKQTCLPFVKDLEPYDDRLRAEKNPLALLKLHGCINHRLDPDVPLILSREHYHRYSRNRTHLFNRLQQWAQSSPVIFIGYSLADPHLRSLIYDIETGKRPQWYIVAPGSDEHDRRFFAGKNVEIISATFGEFVDSLDQDIPTLFRSLKPPVDATDLPYRKHFKTNDAGSDALRESLSIDLAYVSGSVSFIEVEPSKFYSGYDHGWCGIVRNYDFRRKAGDKLLFAALDDNLSAKKQKFLLLQGSAGAGKSIALRRAAYDAATSLDAMVFWLNEAGQPRADVLQELFEVTGKTPVLFVDGIATRANAILNLLQKLSIKNIPITIIGAEREADWGSYCSELEADFPPELHSLKRLSEREAEDLVDLLDRHKCLGLLERKSKSGRIAAFMEEDRADRQLLVALHELTLGVPFEKIILEEYQKITPDAARQLYLDISSMHQFGVLARAGVVSRISGISFEDFEEKFFLPLKDIVKVVADPYTGDKGYQSRHSRVSSIVFSVACQGDFEKAKQLSRIILGLDAGYSSDQRVLLNICRGRRLAQEFIEINAARAIFDAAIEALPDSAFLYQQAAILEYLHKDGSLDHSQGLAEKAREKDEKNHIYLHTLAEVARRQANASFSQIKAQQYRAKARTYLNEMWSKNSRKDLTFCRLLIDEAIETLKIIDDLPKDHEILELDRKVSEAVERLRKAQQDFPDEPEFQTAEGDFWQRLGESENAAKSFEKAITVRPKNVGAFFRLSRIQKAGGSGPAALQTLELALERFPNDKSLHFQMGMFKIESENLSDDEAEYHLRSSFSVGDQNFEARFFLAEFLFLRGKIEESRQLFNEINAKAPAEFRKTSSSSDDYITARMGTFGGSVEQIRDRFFFVRFGGYPIPLLAHMTSLQNAAFDDIEVGNPVTFNIRFNRKGPVAALVWTN